MNGSIALVVNKKAKNASQITNYLRAFDSKQIDYHYLAVEPEELVNTIQDCIKKCRILLVGGGDGTIRSAAQYCVNTSIILGVLPLGTMNHFVKELSLPADIDSLLDAIKEQHTIKIDLAEVNGLIFVNNSSLGVYPKFARKRDFYAKSHHKWLSYLPSIIQTFRRHGTFQITVKNENLNLSLSTSFFMVSNNLYSYQFPAKIERSNFQQKLLGIYFLRYGKLSLEKLFQHLLGNRNNFEVMKSKNPIKVEVKNKEKISISLDGDTVVIDCPLIYKNIPNSLQLLTNK